MGTEAKGIILNIEPSPELARTISETAPENALPIQRLTGKVDVKEIMRTPPAAILANANNFSAMFPAILEHNYPAEQTAVYSIDHLPQAKELCDKEGYNYFELPEQLGDLGQYIGEVSNLSSKA